MGDSCDRMDCSATYQRELSWKWKIENQSRKWNMMRTFIIQMSIRSSLVGPGTRWIEPKELLKRPLSARKVEGQASLVYDWPNMIINDHSGLF
ncbi:hypothetical protein Bca52824_016890 [Brassica carinata]|uniref:Uncharacterized protein n=1 Tax=Brassica carinata TaxID=52824 RepID=A0A8X8B6Y4_BRACI|nr:hypothetical protein Bca52824_016890 [Brassica carinata]